MTTSHRGPRVAHCRLACVVALLCLAGCAAPGFPTGGTWVDLGHDFADDTIYWPTAERFQYEMLTEGMTDKGYFYSAGRFSMAEHGGTHVDAPLHFAEGRATVDRIPLARLIGPAAVVDVSGKALADRDYLVSIDDLRAWEARHGRLPDGAIVLLHTGYGRFWPDAARYLGTAARGEAALADLHFPGLDGEAAAWLVHERRIAAVGLDTASIDRGTSRTYPAHVTLFAADVPAFENVAGLDRLPATGAFVVALPMKIRGGTGGPLRIVAWVPE